MNRILGWLSFTTQKPDQEKFTACTFKTPHWRPDHEAFFFDKKLTLSATQRFITPECAECLMPYQDSESGLVINADVYLTNREELCALLSVQPQQADAKLILKAYLKWGEKCTRYLAGQFCFVIWDGHKEELFAAVNQFSTIPLFYSYQPGEFFIFANEFSPFRQLCPALTPRTQHFIEFALDTFSQTQTGYHEVLKLAPGHQLVINKKGLRQQCYWRLQDQKKKLPYKTREEYYAAFRQQFKRAVNACLRGIGPITSHISGGLDSSAVAAQAATLLTGQEKNLLGITSVPRGLEGPSYRKNWYYHEMPRVQTLLDRYSNIKHFSYVADPQSDIFATFKAIHHLIDQPLRNVTNFDWILGSYQYARNQGGRTLLTGQAGNGSISWAGSSWRDIPRKLYHALKVSCKPHALFDGFFDVINPALLTNAQSKTILRRRGIIWKSHEWLLSGTTSSALISSVYPLQLWHGVRALDPTRDLELTHFCYNVPQKIYRKGKKILQKRLLVREGLRDLLPDAIALNPYRGEQAADAYLQYNIHQKIWKNALDNLSSEVKQIVWNIYDEKSIMDFFQHYSNIEMTANQKMLTRYTNLMRCMSMALYLNDAVQNEENNVPTS